MGLSINTNVMSLNAQRNLGKSQNALGKSMQRLSSGLRINSAKDDSAGLGISDKVFWYLASVCNEDDLLAQIIAVSSGRI